MTDTQCKDVIALTLISLESVSRLVCYIDYLVSGVTRDLLRSYPRRALMTALNEQCDPRFTVIVAAFTNYDLTLTAEHMNVYDQV